MVTPCGGKGIRGFIKVYKFVLLLALSIMVSSQAVAAVKWSNSTSKEEDAQTKAERENHWTNNLQKVLEHQSQYIKGVNQQQEAKINEIGDPLKCISKMKSINSINDGNLITVNDYNKSPSILQRSLNTNRVTILDEGIYQLKSELSLYNGNILIGRGNVLLEASKISTAIRLKKGTISSLKIHKAQKTGIDLIGSDSSIFNVIISNTGIDSPTNTNGSGVNAYGIASHSNCLVSVEVYNGYNATSNDGKGSSTEKGGNADGFALKYGVHNTTLIDTHGHHNSDDGFDFWKAGNESPIDDDEITLRVFYSSANLNGKNPLSDNGDGNGFKFGSKDKYQQPKKDKGARLIHGSVACRNLARGFDRNGTKMKIVGTNLQAKYNPKSDYQEVSTKSLKDDNKLKCSMFPTR